jgi:hypothetical protein
MSPQKNHKEIEEIMSSLDRLDRAGPSDAFEDSLFDRLEQMPPSSSTLIQWFKWSVAAMLVLGILNGYVLIRQQNTLENEAVTALWETDDYFSTSDLFIESNPNQP